MKFSVYFLLFALFLQKRVYTQTVITGNIKNKMAESVSLLRPVNGFSNETIYDEAIVSKISTNGFFKIRTTIGNPLFSKIIIDNEPFWVVLEGKDSINLEIDFDRNTTNFSDAFKVTGTNARGIWLLNKINYNPFTKFLPIHDLISNKIKFSTDSLFTRCTQIIQNQIAPFETLLAERKISKNFFEITKYSLTGVLLQEFIHKLVQSNYYVSQITIDDLLNYFNQEINLRDSICNPVLKRCYFNEIVYQKYFELMTLKSSGLKYYKPMKDSLLFFNKQAYKISSDYVSWIENIPLDIKENIWGKALYGTANLFPTLLNKDDLNYFEKIFPQSHYLNLIQNALTIQTFSDDAFSKSQSEICIIDSTGNKYHTLAQLLDCYKGTVLYIDIWASWCAPCKFEFRNEKKLDTILLPYKVKRLYLSIDNKIFTSEWMKNIFSYHLSGDHLIAGVQMQEDLKSEIYSPSEPFSIPRYIIVNKEGNILNKDAPRPGEVGALKAIFEKL